jgi:hypothetical protein
LPLPVAASLPQLAVQLLFLALVLCWGGRYPAAAQLPRPRLLHLEVIGVFLIAFLANAWRSVVIAQGSPAQGDARTP